MEPLVAAVSWNSYTPTVPELLQNRSLEFAVQIVQGALSVATDEDLGPLVDLQGVVLRTGQAVDVAPNEIVRYRVYRARDANAAAAIGRIPQ